jgi:hypothetical protein
MESPDSDRSARECAAYRTATDMIRRADDEVRAGNAINARQLIAMAYLQFDLAIGLASGREET